jgi:hypothetical protein
MNMSIIILKGIYIKGEEGDRKYTVYLNETSYDSEKVSISISEEISDQNITANSSNLSLFGIQDRFWLSRILFVAGILFLIFLIVVIEVIVISVRRSKSRRAHG